MGAIVLTQARRLHELFFGGAGRRDTIANSDVHSPEDIDIINTMQHAARQPERYVAGMVMGALITVIPVIEQTSEITWVVNGPGEFAGTPERGLEAEDLVIKKVVPLIDIVDGSIKGFAKIERDQDVILLSTYDSSGAQANDVLAGEDVEIEIIRGVL